MAPNKFENNIKKTLEERQIQPSSLAWNQLSNALDKQDKKSTKKYVWLVGIAASIIGVLLVLNSFQPFQTKEKTSLPAVVNAEKTDLDSEKEIELNVPVRNGVANNNVAKSIITEEENEVKKQNKVTGIYTINQVASSKETSQKTPDFSDTNKSAQNNKNNEIVSENNRNSIAQNRISQSEVVKNKSEVLLNSEVDVLLKQAKSKISTVTVSKESTNKINANSLLEDVELDLEKSFRDKVFEALKTNFTIVKTAVADRNN